ncbi:MAG TPA: hypothetical protein ENH33_07270 [Actinobacteria bacterium]|nr:hypothetical protein [Actinomycetota bacterium]
MIAHLSFDNDHNWYNPGQARLLRSTSWRVLMAGGYGAGKTTGICLKLLQLKAYNPGIPGVLVAPSWRMMWRVTLPALMRVCRASLPKQMWPVLRDKQGEAYLDFGDGAKVYLASAFNPESLEGFNAGWGAGDELRYWKLQSYQNLLARVRLPCPFPQIAFASTPTMGWMSDVFNTGRDGHQLITAPTKENLRHLAPSYLTRLRQSYSPRLQRSVLDGIFTVLEGAVFEAFDPNPVTSPWIVRHDPRARGWHHNKHYLCIDPGYRRSAWIWIQQLAETQWIVIDQAMLDNTTDGDAVREVNRRGWPIDEIWIDPAAKQKQSTMGLDTLTLVRQVKTRTKKMPQCLSGPFREIPYGIDKTRVMLGDQFNPMQPMRIGFTRELADKEEGGERGIIRSLGSTRYPDDREGRPVRDLPYEDHSKHAVDAFRYFSVGMWVSTPSLRRQEEDSRMKHAGPGYKNAA